MYNTFLSAALCLGVFGVSSAFDAPSFCRDLECPAYKVIETTDDYELREYSASEWIVARGDGSQRGLFMKLFRYISGANAQEKKIDMTVPVLKKYRMTGNGVENENQMAFFTELSNPPRPTERNVELQTLPKMRVYVKSYGWWSSDSKVAMHLETLKKAIPSRVQVDTQNAYFAGYDSPWTVLDRHNEVWLVEI